jgi:hypothetical protein
VLTLGADYSFKVKARNSVGLSDLSDAITVLVAQAPDQPSAPTTSISGDNTLVTWSAPYDGGTAILSYKVEFLH